MYDKNHKEKPLPMKSFIDSFVDLIDKLINTSNEIGNFNISNKVELCNNTHLPYMNNCMDAVITHPPYVAAVPYAEYGCLSLEWLGYNSKELDAEITGGKRHRKDVAIRFEQDYNLMMTPEDAYALLECIAKISGTEDRLKKMAPEGHEILDEETAREVAKEAKRGRFKFSKYEIPVGAIIKYINDPSIEATVVDDRHISYKGVTTSTSALAQELLESDYPVQGTAYFTYEGEKLTDRRDRMESETR